MRILIVDDDFTSRRLLQTFLRGRGEVDLACNGAEAWQAYSEALKEGAPYGLILLDIMMPEMDGSQVLRLIREREAKTNRVGDLRVAIVMATVRADKQSVLSSFNDQCDGYIRKPYTPTTVAEDLSRFGVRLGQ